MESIIESARPTDARGAQLFRIFLVNLIPLYGVLFQGWDARLLILTYFLETFVAVLVQALRMYYVHFRWGRAQSPAAETVESNFPPVYLPLFMIALCGVFSGVQLLIMGGFADKSFPEGIFTALIQSATGPLAWATAAFAGLQTMQLLSDIVTEKHRNTRIDDLFLSPLARIFIQQFTVIIGGFFALGGSGKGYVFVLFFVKLAVDIIRLYFDHAWVKALAAQSKSKT